MSKIPANRRMGYTTEPGSAVIVLTLRAGRNPFTTSAGAGANELRKLLDAQPAERDVLVVAAPRQQREGPPQGGGIVRRRPEPLLDQRQRAVELAASASAAHSGQPAHRPGARRAGQPTGARPSPRAIARSAAASASAASSISPSTSSRSTMDDASCRTTPHVWSRSSTSAATYRAAPAGAAAAARTRLRAGHRPASRPHPRGAATPGADGRRPPLVEAEPQPPSTSTTIDCVERRGVIAVTVGIGWSLRVGGATRPSSAPEASSAARSSSVVGASGSPSVRSRRLPRPSAPAPPRPASTPGSPPGPGP